MLNLRVCIVPGCAKDLDLVLGTNSTVNSIVPLGLLVKMRVHGISRVMKNECAEREKGDLMMRPCVKSLGPRGISRVEKAHLSCCEMRNELRECESGAQIGVFSLTDFYSWPISEAIR